MSNKHTPTPWKIVGGDKWQIVKGNRPIANCGGLSNNIRHEEVNAENQANAALIVRAVNAYEKLLAVKEAATRLVENGEYREWTGDFEELQEIKGQLLAALNDANGEG